MTIWRARGAAAALFVLAISQAAAQGPSPATNVRFPAISQTDLREWLTYLSSDELQGRQVFSEGYGIATQYIAERLREFGVKPLGDHGTYFQIVRLRSYKVVHNSSVTVEANGQRRTFKDGDHVSFPLVGGGRQTFVASMTAAAQARGTLTLQAGGSAATIEFSSSPIASVERPLPAPADSNTAPGRARGNGPTPDIPPTTQRVDAVTPPKLKADETFYAALSGSTGAVRVTIDVDNTYQVLTTQLTRNVVGMVEGSDPRLKDTYVMFGAHLDHVGYATSAQDARGRVNTSVANDPIWNGADDDGTGSTAEIAIAKAFATGPRPRRSIVFVWHTGEEADLYGSGYNADFPVVPLDKVQCQLNIDMIGRNRDNDPAQNNTVFVIGADRISTDLHNLIVDTNATLRQALTLDYEYNDAGDPNSFYTRSDHYSYASKGVPIAFFFTGEHPDYHANTDSVEKILFDKQARVAQLVYQVGFAAADSDLPLRRDNQGPRAGKGFTGRIR